MMLDDKTWFSLRATGIVKLKTSLQFNVRKYAEMRGLSLNKLAVHARMSRSYMYTILNKDANPTICHLLSIALALDVKVEDLLANHETPNDP